MLQCFNFIVQIFEKVRKDQPNFKEKFVAINGDILQPEMGISKSDRKMLEQEIQIVFHSAATIRFTEPLRYVFPALHVAQ